MDINTLFKGTYLKAADVKAAPRTLTIVSIAPEAITDDTTKPVIKFAGEEQGFVVNKTNAMLMAAYFGNETDGWTGQQVELYSEPVSFQGKVVDSIRVRRPTLVAAVAPVAPPVAPAAPEKPADVVAELKEMDDATKW